jgi:hypothetical protein
VHVICHGFKFLYGFLLILINVLHSVKLALEDYQSNPYDAVSALEGTEH